MDSFATQGCANSEIGYRLEKARAEIHQPKLGDLIGAQLDRAKAEVSRLEELSALLQANPELTRAIELLGAGKGLY